MGLSGLVFALLRFARHPFSGVLVALGALALFLYSAANLMKTSVG